MSTLGNRMKAYENVWHTSVPPNSYVILRLDGRAFHTLLRNADKPYDQGVGYAMKSAAQELCEQVSGAEFAYVQSDEISVLLTDVRTVRSQLWFDGDIQKLASVSASIVTSAFNDFTHPSMEVEGLAGIDRLAHFDARVLTLPHPVEVANYFVWRQRDAQRNAISMAAQAEFSHQELHGKDSDQMRTMLRDRRGITFPDDYPARFTQGEIVMRVARDVWNGWYVTNRRVWKSEPAPQFQARTGNWLAENIPAQPAWLDE